jgi:hypothetical protein
VAGYKKRTIIKRTLRVVFGSGEITFKHSLKNTKPISAEIGFVNNFKVVIK